MIIYDLLAPLFAILALAAGMAAPDFEAVSYDGRKINLSALHRQGPVMLVFLRGFG
jgi:peroxiredoxin